MIPTVNNICCSLSLRTGSIFIAVFYLFLMLLSVAHYQGYLKNKGCSEDKDSGCFARTGYSLLSVFILFVCVIVLVGVFMRRSILLLIGGIVFYYYLLSTQIMLVLREFIDTGELQSLIFGMLIFLLSLYCGIILWSHGKQLQ